MDEQQKKAILYGGGGLVDEKLLTQPIKAEERHNKHRAVDNEPCFDCGNMIDKGNVKIVSVVTLTQGVKAQTWSMSIHPECYEVLGKVMSILPIEARTIAGRGRPSLRDLWAQHRAAIEDADYRLGRMLSAAFDQTGV